MKRTLIASGVILAAVAFVPGAVSAHSYDDYNGHYGNWDNAKTADWHGDYDNSWYQGHDSWYQKSATTWHENSYQHEWADEDSATSHGTIVDALVNKGNFTTLVTAVQAAGLAETLSAPGDLTVFAPTDQAFANLPEGTVESLLANPTALAEVLKNHVVAGRVDGDAAIWYGEALALTGNTLNIGYGDDGVLYIDDARITVTDIETSNGIVHVIDAVLVPKM